MTPSKNGKTISASDVEKYGYCPLSWWLSEQNNSEEKESLKKGSEKHAEIGQNVKAIKTQEEMRKESERSLILFSLIAIVIGINGMAIGYTIYAPPSQGQVIMILLSVISILWIFVAVMFFYTGIKLERGIKAQREESAKQEQSLQKGTKKKGRASEAKFNTIIFFLVSGILAMHGFLILLNLEPDQSQLRSRIFLILSLLWLIGSSLFYYISLKGEMRSKETEKEQPQQDSKWNFSQSEMSVILFAVISTILASNAMTVFQNPPSDIARILFVVAILWLYGGFIFLYRSLRANVRLRLIINMQLKLKNILGIKAQKDLSNIDMEQATLTYERGVIWFAIVAMILAINAGIMNFSRNLEELYGTLIAHIFEVIALLWLIGAAFFLYVVLISSKTAANLREEHGIEADEIEYVDALDNTSKMLSSEKYDLRGRPDYILKRDNELVPVEVKTGRTPKGPLFSHILQLAAYCLLVEENYKTYPSYGIIKYSDKEHEIQYDDELKKILVSKLKEMKEIFITGEAHRNHKRETKCKYCSRRKICPEKLV
jgi:CRISPR-associated exonuclease Cas4